MLSKNLEAIRKRLYRRANREKYNASIKTWRTAHPGYWRKKRDAQVKKQHGKCAICKRMLRRVPGSSTYPYWDHDHKCCPANRSCANCLRGVLCPDCNQKLAALEKPGWLAKGQRYLKKWRVRR